ncbi:hypothetical protein [Mesobacillus harenae]|nr:hypothetical protein [Mesobacillus harenae]
MEFNKPDMQVLDQLDTAVLFQKKVVINGMINYGNKPQKEYPQGLRNKA